MRRKVGASLFCPFLLRERFPLAFFLLTNERRPRFRLRIECELVRQLALSKLEFNREELLVDFAAAEFGIFCAKDVDPVTNIIFRDVIEADENERFIFRLRVGRTVVKLDELMIEHPLAMHTRLLYTALAHVSFYSPVADEIVEKSILQRRWWLRAGDYENQEEEKQRCRFFH